MPLLEAMREQGWCQKVPTLLQLSDHDSREHVLAAMQTLVDSCKQNFKQSHETLNGLRTEYVQLAREEDDGDYFKNLLTVIDGLIQDVSVKEEL